MSNTTGNQTDTESTNTEPEDMDVYVLHVQSERRTVDQWVAVRGTSKTDAENTFTDTWNAFEVEVRIPHYNGTKFETVFAPNQTAAETAAPTRSGEYSDVISEVKPWDIDVTIIETLHAENANEFKHKHALGELPYIESETPDGT